MASHLFLSTKYIIPVSRCYQFLFPNHFAFAAICRTNVIYARISSRVSTCNGKTINSPARPDTRFEGYRCTKSTPTLNLSASRIAGVCSRRAAEIRHIAGIDYLSFSLSDCGICKTDTEAKDIEGCLLSSCGRRAYQRSS